MPTWDQPAQGLPHPFVLPPRSQHTQAKNGSKNLQEWPLEHVNTGRGCPAGWVCLTSPFPVRHSVAVPGTARREHLLPPAGTGGDDTQRVEQGWSGSLAQSSPCSLLWLAGICPTPSFRAVGKSVAPCVAPHLAVLRPGCCCGLSPAASQAHPRLCGWINPSVSLCLSHCFLIPNPD